MREKNDSVRISHADTMSRPTTSQHPLNRGVEADCSEDDAEDRLTPRQREVASRLAKGMSEKEIAFDLGVSTHTAHDHVKAIHRVLGVRSRGELLVRLFMRTRLVAESA